MIDRELGIQVELWSALFCTPTTIIFPDDAQQHKIQNKTTPQCLSTYQAQNLSSTHAKRLEGAISDEYYRRRLLSRQDDRFLWLKDAPCDSRPAQPHGNTNPAKNDRRY
jgi:hypothetical protein